MSFVRRSLSGASLAVLTACLAPQLHAQDNNSKDRVEISSITIEAKKKRSAILPTRSDAFGLGLSQVQTPRSAATVSLAMIDQYSLKTVRDLIAVSPGVFTASFYGVDGTVNIRGEYADNYFRDFKRVENQGTYETPIESALNLEVVRGIASPAYGGGRAGGYVNFTPHSDRAERFMDGEAALGEVDFTLGSYRNENITAEYGAPIKIGDHAAGYNLYLQQNRDAEYFYNIQPKHILFQGGFALDLGDGWTTDMGVQYYKASGMQGTTGLNRVTQNLIDNDEYTSGSFEEQLVQPGQKFVTQADINNAGGVTEYYAATSPYSTLNPATIKTVKLSYRDVLTSPLDVGNVHTATGYFDVDHEVVYGTLKLQAFADSLKADSYNGYGFAKSLRDRAYEARASYNAEIKPASWIDINEVAGIGHRIYLADEKYDYALGYMVLDREDLAAGATPDSIFDPVYITNTPWDQDYHSRAHETYAFTNADIALPMNVHVIGGIRYDYYQVAASDTGLLDYSVALNTTYTASQGRPSYSISVNYASPIGLVPYFTYARSWAMETLQGGALAPGDIAGDTWLSPSTLTEFGAKGSYFNNNLFFAIASYQQTREQAQLLSNSFNGAVSHGQEAEFRLALNKHFSFSGTATRQQTYIHGCSYLYSTPQEIGVPNQDGWGYVYEVASCDYAGLENGYVDKTQPQSVWGLFGNYEMGNGLGATLGFNHVSHTSGELPGAVIFPDYYLWRGSAHYDWRSYRVSFFIDNIFDKRYYIPQRSTETEGSVMPGEGRTWSVKFTAKF